MTVRDVVPQVASERIQTKMPEKVANNISMRLKDNEYKFSRDTTECWDEYVINCRQITRDYKLSDAQKIQNFHNIISKYAKNVYNNVVAPMT